MSPIRFFLFLAVLSAGLRAGDLAPALALQVQARVAEVKTWAADPAVVGAVVAQNGALPPAYAGMTQENWKALTILDPFVRSFSKNPAGLFLKSRKAPWVSEAFLSDAKGLKVAFLSKPSNWSHAGRPKHDQPLAGQDWQGAVELDESTGLQQLQVAVPVLKDGSPVGVLTVGISLSKLGQAASAP
jgi:hypothetical protein